MRLQFAVTTLAIFVVCGLANGQDSRDKLNSPDRDLPPRLADFLRKGDASPAKVISNVFELQKLEIENRRIKQSLQELQLERLDALMSDPGERGNVLRSSVWPNRTIEVHWDNPEAAPEEERNWVRDAISRTWERNSQLRFTGWDRATSSSRGIRIRIAEDGPHCKRLGRHLDGVADGMVLNFTFQSWCPSCGIDRKGSIEKIAVHEFGHAIGFAHEQNRTDAPDWCRLERQGTDGDWYITIYDPDSIMNYCNPRWNNSGLLSDLDVRAVRILYGAPTPSPTPAPASTPAPTPAPRQ